MIDWLKRKLFPAPLPMPGPWESDPKWLERQAQEAAMRAEQAVLQRALGINEMDSVQAWLRLHQLLKSHEDRLAALEAKAAPKPRARKVMQ